jgi:undecaprenyl-diphosphatase
MTNGMKVILLCAIFFAFSVVSFCDDMMTPKESVILGLTQGITEFMPVSSTGHLILVDRLMSNAKVLQSSVLESVENVRLQARNAYFVIIQFGSIFAVMLLYRRRFVDMALGVLVGKCSGCRLTTNLLISFLPTAILGFFVDGWVQKKLYGTGIIAAALIIGSIIMLLAERSYRQQHVWNGTIDTLDPRQSLLIGLWQCISLVPGMSRSMTAIVGGYKSGLRRSEAVEYSFLLGCVTSLAAAMYKFVKDFDVILSYFAVKTFSLGILVTFVSSIAVVKILVSFISRFGIALFAWYRIILAIIIFSVFYT